MKGNTRLLLTSCGIAAMVFAQPVVAQETPASSASSEEAAGQSGEIIVTAQGRTQRLRDVPVSVTVASAEDLSRTNIRGLEELSARLPNVKISTSPTSDYINIRGVGSSANTGFEQSVGTFLDGIYRGRSRSSRSALFDVEQVEVLRGPQTTFFGNNTIAGALNITSRKAGDDFAVNANAFYSPTFREYSLEGGVDVPLTETLTSRLAVRAAGMNKGYLYSPERNQWGPRLASQNVRLSFGWAPASGVEVDARIDYGHQNDRDNFNSELLNCPPDATFGGVSRGACLRYVNGVGIANVDDDINGRSDSAPSLFKQEYVEGAVNVRIPVGSSTLILTTGYYNHSNQLMYDASPVPSAYRSPLAGVTNGTVVNYFEDFEQYSQEVRLRSPGDRTIDYIAGVYFAHTRSKWDNSVGFFFADLGAAIGRSGDPVGIRVLNDETSTTASAFAALTFRLADGLKFNLAGRYTIVDKSAGRTPMVGYSPNRGPLGPDNFTRYSAAQEAALQPAVGEDPGNFDRPSRRDKKFMPTAGLQYNVTPDIMLYGSYAKGFKAGGYSVITVKSDFSPETVDNFELGFKSSFFDRKVNLDVNLFHGQYKDLQESVTVIQTNGVAVARVANVADSVSKGVEATLSIRPLEGLTLRADVAYLNSKYTRYNNAPCTQLQVITRPAPCTQDLSGSRRPFAPEVSGNAGIDYAAAVSDGMQLRLSGSMFFSGFYYLSPVADRRNLAQDGFAKFDARIAFGPASRAWEVAIVGRNLTDRITFAYALPMPGAAGTFFKLPEAPRSFGIQLSGKF